jgi:hypothetical protein
VENRSRMGSTSITTTTYGADKLVVKPYYTLSPVDSLIPDKSLA